MEDDEKIFLHRLKSRTYRNLQQLAKSFKLPSNIKKVYLIELIHAKKFRTERDVENIIERVRLERLQLSKVRRENLRRRKQITNIASTSRSCFSPPITMTPKRPSQTFMSCSPELCRNLMLYNPKRSLLNNTNHKNPQDKLYNASDRVLRSFNLRTAKPNYALMNSACMHEGSILKARNNTNAKETRIKIITNGGSFPQFNVTAKCLVKKHKPNIMSDTDNRKRKLLLAQNVDFLQNPIPAKRSRTLSGIYPLLAQESIPVPRNFHAAESVCLRKTDGSMTKINALVQKRSSDLILRQNNCLRNVEINLQDIMNSIDEEFTDNITDPNINSLQIQYPNMSSIDQPQNNINNVNQSIKENEIDLYSVYYHKKIRAEQIRSQRLREMQECERLPKIGEVFSKFNHNSVPPRKDYNQPLYIEVSTESERSQSIPFIPKSANTIMLESVYNFKNNFITNAPLLQIATTSETKCVYSAPTMVTAVAHPSKIMCNETYVNSFEVGSRNNDIDPPLCEFLQFHDQNNRRSNLSQSEDFSTTSSIDTSQEASTSSIPEMVEDALEIIRQDGNYMERIGMDVRVQCILCPWAGPKIILENHIRKEHTDQVHKHSRSEWSISYTLGSLVQCRLWLGQVIEHHSVLYVLSAKYEDPDCLMASLTSLSPEPIQRFGTITIYNKVSGEPYSWNGLIQTLPPNLPYENESNCLKLNLSKLNLLPNSANIKLLNRELVINSPSKVIVGQPILNDIHITLFVKIFN